MIANWMLYCVAVGVLLGCGALALERAVRPLGVATRWVWAAALLLTLAVPAAARFVGPLRPAVPTPRTGAASATVTATVASLPRKRERAFDPARLDAPLSLAWGASSAAVVLALAGMAAVLERRRLRWARAEVDGVPVFVSGDTGPAVVGLLRSRIVLPRWALDADAEARRLVLEHEQEHVRAGDPQLLAAGLCVAALMPWNPAVWWALRRLRLAVEVDCDARVLRRRADVRAYGSVLLEVGRRAVHSRLTAAAFAEPVSSLERRIRIMTAPRVRRPLLRAAGFGALAAALVAAACDTPAPTQPSAGGARALYRAPGENATFARTALTPESAVRTYFPEVLERGMAANEVLLFVLSSDGEVVRHEWVSGNWTSRVRGTDALSADQVRSVDVLKRPAGELGPTPVQMVWVQFKAPGEARNGMKVSVHGGAPLPGQQFKVARTRTRDVGFAEAASTQPAARESDTFSDQVQAAMERFYTPQMLAAGIRGEARAEYTVDANGKAHILSITTGVPALEPVMRRIAESLTLDPSAGRPVNLVIDFGPRPDPARSR
jgi:beta-lactamase regulating signal transducer with metallopeptidase domain